jgi:hypothetical protein
MKLLARPGVCELVSGWLELVLWSVMRAEGAAL